MPARLADPDVIARHDERAMIAAFLDFVDAEVPGAKVLVLRGDAGMGKTALWEWALRRATAAGQQVLVSRAGLAEAQLPWVALADLLSAVPVGTIAALPPPQRQALQVLTLQEAPVEPLDERAVGTAFLTVLGALAAVAPVLLAVDDLPYVDAASAGALRFALRRLPAAAPANPVRLVATLRDGGSVAVSPAPLDALPADAVQAVDVGGLSVGALYELLATRLGVRLARPVLVRVHETSGGNPLYAIELARALDRVEIHPTPGVPLPMPTELGALVADRVASLPHDVLAIVAGTAAAWRFTDKGLDPSALEAAERAGVVIVEQSAKPRVVRAMHPLLAAAAYAALPPPERRALHERLAAQADEPVERARHAALATAGPSEEVALVIDAGVMAALAAGTPDIAVDLGRLAVDRTAGGAKRRQRLDRLADALVRAGDAHAAVDAQRQAVALTPAGPERAVRRTRLAELLVEVEGWGAAEQEMRVAVAEAAADPTVQAETLFTLAAVTDDTELAETSADQALRLLESLPEPDPAIVAAAMGQVVGTRFRAGRGLDHDLCLRAIELETHFPRSRLSDRADAGYAALLKYADDLDEAETRLLKLLDEARASGDLTSIAYTLGHLPHIAAWRGDLAAARRLADEHLAVSEQGHLVSQLAQARYNLGYVQAHQGHLDEARRTLRDMQDEDDGSLWFRQRAAGALGFVELSAGNATEAVAHLDDWDAVLTRMHFREPGYSRSHLDYLCALVATGRIGDARDVIERLADQVATSGRASAGAVVRTGRAMVLATEGEVTGARAEIEAALAYYETSPLRFDRARTLLVAGQIHRRAKAKTLAHEAIGEAIAEFQDFGALAWAAQAAHELARVNLRPSAPDELTETERRVARLAATGLTNREVAERMFLAVKTVEANLARAYRKLGIRSRAELGARLGRRSA